MKDKNWIWIALTILLLAALSTIVENNFDARKRERRLTLPQYVYSPNGCLYQIEFRDKPKVDERSGTDGTSVLKAETAELVMLEDESFVRSEFIVLGRDTLKHLTKDVLYGILQEYALLNGLSYPEFTYSESTLGTQVDLRGYKTLKNKALTERRLVYTAKLFLKENNLLIMYAGSEAENYPTPGIVEFFNSIKLKGKDPSFLNP